MLMTKINLPRVPLAHLPTAIEPLERISAELGGPSIWIKRDDATGLAFGGNKTRKLEYLLADAESKGAKTVLTRGAVQSNHCRQTAAAAARRGLDCILVLGGVAPEKTIANLLLDRLLGAEIHWVEEGDPETLLAQLFEQAQEENRHPYLVPYGGSNPLGAAAYAAAMGEMIEQKIEFDRIIFATSSGGTQAGMIVGADLYQFSGMIQGISVDKRAVELRAHIAPLAMETAEFLGHRLKIQPDEIVVEDGYLGDGYAVMSNVEREAINLFARQEGILLDPVYTGRAVGGMIDLIKQGKIPPDERILFWHTGGTPALFAYGDELV
jgi:D-cysteine desulfhydrase family pyridoxal phosphate-dependent enzyme